MIDYRKVKALVDKGWKVKPHPITAHVYMADLRRRFGAENVLNKKRVDMNSFLIVNKWLVPRNSEMGLIALLLGKDIQMVSFPVSKKRSVY